MPQGLGVCVPAGRQYYFVVKLMALETFILREISRCLSYKTFIVNRFTPKDDVKPYNIYGVTVCEVEVDLLTGQHQVRHLEYCITVKQELMEGH